MHTICIADTHLTSSERESGSLFPNQLAGLPEEEAEILYQIIREEVHSAFASFLRWSRENGTGKTLIHLGDITGGYHEQGACHPSVQILMRETQGRLRNIFPRVRFVLGEHDTGFKYHHSLPHSGINLESILFCQKTIDDIFWHQEEEGLLSIGLCSPLTEYNGDNPKIIRLREEQVSFLGDTLDTHKGPWSLYLHNPLAITKLVKPLQGHIQQLQRMIAGHFHNLRGANLLKRAVQIFGSSLLHPVTVQCFRKHIPCPSIAPLWSRGYNFLALSQNRTKVVSLNRPPQNRQLPVSSFWKCLWWRIKPTKT